MPIHIGTCFRFYMQMLYMVKLLTMDFILECIWKKKQSICLQSDYRVPVIINSAFSKFQVDWIMYKLRFPPLSNWRPPGNSAQCSSRSGWGYQKYRNLALIIAISCLITPTMPLPFEQGKNYTYYFSFSSRFPRFPHTRFLVQVSVSRDFCVS